jgi:integrase
VRERGLQGNPARALAAPKKRDVPTEIFPPSVVERIIGAQTYPADIIGVTLILRYGLRRGGVVNARRRDFDLERRLLTVHTKGRRIYPLPDEALGLALGRLELEAQWQEDHWLLYRRDTRRMRVDLEEAEEILTIKSDRVGHAKMTRRRHERKRTGKLAHLWWYRCLVRAGQVARGMHMHRGRHTAATELQRSHHDLRLTQLLLGHADIRSAARYAQLDTADLPQALLELQKGSE